MVGNGITAKSPMCSGIRDFLTWCRMEKGLSRNSLEAYARDLEDLRAFTEPLAGGSLPDVELLNKHINQLYTNKLSGRSIARHVSSIRSFFSFLVTEDKVTEDPTGHLTSPKPGATIPKFLSRQQMESLRRG